MSSDMQLTAPGNEVTMEEHVPTAETHLRYAEGHLQLSDEHLADAELHPSIRMRLGSHRAIRRECDRWSVLRILCKIYRDPAGCTGEKETESGQEERQRKRNMGLVYAVIWCAQTPPPPSFASCLTCLLVWLSEQEVQRGAPPPPCHPHPISTVRGLSGGSLGQPLIWRS
jgi:hypothetical protein